MKGCGLVRCCGPCRVPKNAVDVLEEGKACEHTMQASHECPSIRTT